MTIPLTVLACPYREITRPVLEYVTQICRQSPCDVVTVYIPEYVVGHWREQLLHNPVVATPEGQAPHPTRGHGHLRALPDQPRSPHLR